MSFPLQRENEVDRGAAAAGDGRASGRRLGGGNGGLHPVRERPASDHLHHPDVGSSGQEPQIRLRERRNRWIRRQAQR